MERILELIQAVREKYPNDDFFISIEQKLKDNVDHVKKYYDEYNKALMTLDDESWSILKIKAIKNSFNSRKGQRKQGFFNHLNEAFAYQYLVTIGCTNTKVLAETNVKKTPDISYEKQGEKQYCEVKSIGISDDEITRRSTEGYVDRSMYISLSDCFFNKLGKDIEVARDQINPMGKGLVFCIIKFDDFTGSYQETYRNQIKSYINQNSIKNIYIKFIQGYESIGNNP